MEACCIELPVPFKVVGSHLIDRDEDDKSGSISCASILMKEWKKQKGEEEAGQFHNHGDPGGVREPGLRRLRYLM